MQARYIREDQLIELLRSYHETIADWRQGNHIRPDMHDELPAGVGGTRGHPLYLHTTVDQALQLQANQPLLPGVAELLALMSTTGKPVFLTVEEVATQLQETTRLIRKVVSRGELLATRVVHGGHWLIPVTGLASYLKACTGEGAVSAGLVMKFLGLTNTRAVYVERLVRGENAPLTKVGVLGRRDLHVTLESFMAFLDEHVMTGTGEEWWQMRSDHNFEPLMSMDGVRARCRIHERRVQAYASDGTFPCLRLVSGKRVRLLFPTHAIEQWAADRQAYTPDVLATIFGTNVAARATWNALDLCPERHDYGGGVLRAEVCPARACVVRYINSHRTSDGLDGDQWLREVFEDKALPTLIKNLESDQDIAENLIASGEICGVRLPDGDVALNRSNIVILRQRVRRLERDIFGGDYHQSVNGQ